MPEQKVLLDKDLAELYGVTTFSLNKAVKRNLNRFPEDFMFQLTKEENESLRFQTGISKPVRRGGRRYLPYAFTEQGVAMLSSVLHSDTAVAVSIAIIASVRATPRHPVHAQRPCIKRVQKISRNILDVRSLLCDD